MSEPFIQQCREAARDFLQTVVIIDDGLTFGVESNSPTPHRASRASGNLLGDKATLVGNVGNEHAPNEPRATPEAHPLNALELTSAFFDNELVAGLYKPTAGSIQRGIIEHSVATAKKSDVVIIDWSLEEPGKTGSSNENTKNVPSHLATEIIIKLVSDDYLHGGKLRTIIVYTAEKDLTGIRDRLQKNLTATKIADFLTEKEIEFQADGDFTITSPNLRIAFYSKPNGASVDTGRKKQISDLPTVVIEEFTSHVIGLLPSFALRSTAAIRQNTHHLLTRFTDSLDGAYLAHRGMIPDPEDAESYMLENLVSVIRSTLSLEQVDRKCLGEDSVSLWTENASTKSVRFTGKCNGKDVDCSPNELKEVFLGGTDKLKALISTKAGTQKNGNELDKAFLEAGRIIAAVTSNEGLERFSVLSAFKRSHEDVGWARPNNAPYLTQGTIIAKVLPSNEWVFLLCITPKCDCLRIGKQGNITPRNFSFAVLEKKQQSESHDLVINMNGQQRV